MVIVPVALGMDEDLFLALAILDAQLVVATAARAAEALEDAAGLITACGYPPPGFGVSADNAHGVIRIWTPPGLPVFVLISNLPRQRYRHSSGR